MHLWMNLGIYALFENHLLKIIKIALPKYERGNGAQKNVISSFESGI